MKPSRWLSSPAALPGSPVGLRGGQGLGADDLSGGAGAQAAHVERLPDVQAVVQVAVLRRVHAHALHMKTTSDQERLNTASCAAIRCACRYPDSRCKAASELRCSALQCLSKQHRCLHGSECRAFAVCWVSTHVAVQVHVEAGDGVPLGPLHLLHLPLERHPRQQPRGQVRRLRARLPSMWVRSR